MKRKWSTWAFSREYGWVGFFCFCYLFLAFSLIPFLSGGCIRIFFSEGFFFQSSMAEFSKKRVATSVCTLAASTRAGFLHFIDKCVKLFLAFKAGEEFSSGNKTGGEVAEIDTGD